jgi:hypothetical protein
MSTSRERPFAVDQAEYPFQDHWFEQGGVAMHYLDEGDGVAVLQILSPHPILEWEPMFSLGRCAIPTTGWSLSHPD